MIRSNLSARLKMVASALPKEEVNKAVIFEETISAWEQAIRDQLLDSIGCGDLMTVPQTPVEPVPFAWLFAMHAMQEAREAAAQNGSPQLGLEHMAIALPS